MSAVNIYIKVEFDVWYFQWYASIGLKIKLFKGYHYASWKACISFTNTEFALGLHTQVKSDFWTDRDTRDLDIGVTYVGAK